MEEKKIVYVQEIYRDKYRTLGQSIMFRAGNEMEAEYYRSKVNPNLSLVETIYLDENFKRIEEEI